MRLTLSTAAAQDLTIPELLEACRLRGLAGLELVAGHAHGIGPGTDLREIAEARAAAAEAGVVIAAYRAASRNQAMGEGAARLSVALSAPVVVPASEVMDDDAIATAATLYARVGGVLLLEHPSDAESAAALRRLAERVGGNALGLAWEADPADPRFAADAKDVLQGAGPFLRHVRLLGGGPEAAGQEGQGIGAMMARLTLAGFRGSLAIAPSTDRYRMAWSAWLGRRGGWGCGSKTADPGLVSLG